jgi:competence protein ComEC
MHATYGVQLLCLTICVLVAGWALLAPSTDALPTSSLAMQSSSYLPFAAKPVPSPTPTPTATPLPRLLDVRVEWSCCNVRGGSTQDPNGEWVCFKNYDSRPADLARWYVEDAAFHRYTFHACLLNPGATVRLHSGAGADTSTDVFWGSGTVWNNNHDTVDLYDCFGRNVSHLQY